MLNDLQLRLLVAQKFRRKPPIITLGTLQRLLGDETIDDGVFARWTNYSGYIALDGVHRGYTIYTLTPMDYPLAYSILERIKT